MTTGIDIKKDHLKSISKLDISSYESFALDTAKRAGHVLMKHYDFIKYMSKPLDREIVGLFIKKHNIS